DDRVIGPGHEKHVKLGRLRVDGGGDEASHERPVGMVTAAGKRPSSREPIAALCPRGLANGLETGRNQAVRRFTPDVLLSAAVEHAGRGAVVREDALHPAGGAASLRDCGGDEDGFVERELMSAENCRL